MIYIPILHTPSEMGSLSPSMREAYVKKFGEQKWLEHVRVIDEIWKGIRKKIRQMKLPYARVKLYQDGLPICGMEKLVMADLAKKGSPNYKLVQWLERRGATLVGTEDLKLLLEEYHHVSRITQAKTLEEHEKLAPEFADQSAALLKKRDKKIADQIDATLNKGETGVLFIGLLHRVDELLPKDIRTRYLIHSLPFRRSFKIEMV